LPDIDLVGEVDFLEVVYEDVDLDLPCAADRQGQAIDAPAGVGPEFRLTFDQGCGIPPAEREAIFEPFYRLDASRNFDSAGSGLGLALTRQIVEAHGGRITASDAPGGGTRMKVLLPLAESRGGGNKTQ